MDYSAANHQLWNAIIQLGYIAIALLASNFLTRNVAFIRKTMLPVAVLGGFLLLAAKEIGIINPDQNFMETLTYHGIAMGFIAMSLRTPEKREGGDERKVGFRSGAVIVSSYMIQGVSGLIITMGLAYTVMPDMFKAAGLLLPMGFGQGPGQANNVGSSYQALGFEGGHSFGLSIAAAGYIVACVVGVILLNVLRKSGKLESAAGAAALKEDSGDYFKGGDEGSASESIDKFTVQLAMITVVYVVTYAVTRALTPGIAMISEGLAGTVNTLLWGFNFIIGSALAILLRIILEKLRERGARRPYQDNYLLNRLSGAFFDIMIVAGIASINIEDIRGLVLPFALLVAAGTVVTWFHLKWVCKAVYPDYYYEGLISMYGMMTGTISSGVLLLRELDHDLSTPAANNLVVGSSFGILLGAPVLVLVGLATRSDLMCFVTLGLAALYLLILDIVIFKVGRKQKT